MCGHKGNWAAIAYNATAHTQQGTRGDNSSFGTDLVATGTEDAVGMATLRPAVGPAAADINLFFYNHARTEETR